MSRQVNGQYVVVGIILLAVVLSFGIGGLKLNASVTDIGNWRAEGVHFVPYSRIVEDTLSDRCDRLSGVYSGGFSRAGTVVFIQCDNLDCVNDPEVKAWNQYGYDSASSFSRYFRGQYYSWPPVDDKRAVSAVFQNEVDFTGYSDKGFTGKVYFIGFSGGGGENIGDFTCSITNHVEFITSSPDTTTTLAGTTTTTIPSDINPIEGFFRWLWELILGIKNYFR